MYHHGAILAWACALLVPPVGRAATSETTTAAGSVSLTAGANSDTRISLPTTRSAVYRGAVTTVSGATLGVTKAPAWRSNELVRTLPQQPDRYYVQFSTGSLAGRYYTIVANGSATLSVDWNGESLAPASGDGIQIFPYWTLITLFPAADAGRAYVASIQPLLRATELLVFDPNYVGINPPVAGTYFFYNGAWRKVGQAVTAAFDDTALPPDSYFIVRNKAQATTVVPTGQADPGPITILLNAAGGQTKQDNLIALPYAASVTLAASNLVGSGAFTPSSSPLLRQDEILVFDNDAAGINKAAAATYYYYNNGWRKVGAAVTADFGATAVFIPGAGVILRKAGTNGAPRTVYWTFTPPP